MKKKLIDRLLFNVQWQIFHTDLGRKQVNKQEIIKGLAKG